MKKTGFTLIELLIVIGVIGVLAALIIVSVSSARGKARDATRKSDLHALRTSLHQYQSDNENFPVSDETWGAIPNLDVVYIKKIPVDPRGANAYHYTAHDGLATNDIEFALECAMDYDLDTYGDASGNPLAVNFVTSPISSLNLSNGYNYAVTSY